MMVIMLHHVNHGDDFEHGDDGHVMMIMRMSIVTITCVTRVTCAGCVATTWRRGHWKVCQDTCRDMGKLPGFFRYCLKVLGLPI